MLKSLWGTIVRSECLLPPTKPAVQSPRSQHHGCTECEMWDRWTHAWSEVIADVLPRMRGCWDVTPCRFVVFTSKLRRHVPSNLRTPPSTTPQNTRNPVHIFATDLFVRFICTGCITIAWTNSEVFLTPFHIYVCPQTFTLSCRNQSVMTYALKIFVCGGT